MLQTCLSGAHLYLPSDLHGLKNCHARSDYPWTVTRISAFLSKLFSRTSSSALSLVLLFKTSLHTSDWKGKLATSSSLSIFHRFQWSEHVYLKNAFSFNAWSSSKFIIQCNLCSRLEGGSLKKWSWNDQEYPSQWWLRKDLPFLRTMCHSFVSAPWAVLTSE